MNDVTVYNPTKAGGVDIFAEASTFEHHLRVAKVFADSQLVPQHLRGKVADCLIGISIARRMNEDPLLVLQNIYVINGKPGWSTQYMIARANRSGIFSTRITWQTTGSGAAMEVTASAVLKATGETVSATASMAMAKAEKWTNNAKYASMPEHMLKWRSATFLIRLYAPEVMMGLSTEDEVEDIAEAQKPHLERATVVDAPARTVSGVLDQLVAPQPAVETVDPVSGEVVETSEADNEEVEARMDLVEESYREIVGHVQPTSARLYEDFVIELAMDASDDIRKDAIRLYWTRSKGLREELGVTEGHTREIVTNMRACLAPAEAKEAAE